jgi:hypothetical protein
VFEPINTQNNFTYKDGQTVEFDYLAVDVFVPTPCMQQQTNFNITPIEITKITEKK